jgi:flagellar motor protein MotB
MVIPSAESASVARNADSVINPAGFAREGRRTLIAVVYFDHGSMDLDATDREVLRSVADLQSERGGKLLVFGHASQRTKTSRADAHQLANFETSFDRAARVSQFLRELGVDPDDLVPVARGSKDPVYYEFMPTGEAGNRRAEIFLEE